MRRGTCRPSSHQSVEQRKAAEEPERFQLTVEEQEEQSVLNCQEVSRKQPMLRQQQKMEEEEDNICSTN